MSYNKLMKTDFKTIFFYIVLAICSIALFTLITITTMDYSRNLLQGYIISGVVGLSYPFILHQSYILFRQKRVGLAYSLVIGLFLVLVSIQMIGCVNSIVWEH